MKKKNKSAQIDLKALRALLKSVAHKTKSHNVVAAAMAVVVIIGLASSTPIQNYFKSQPSSAFGISEPGGNLPGSANYQIVIVPEVQTVASGNIAVYNITLLRQGGFSNPVILKTDLIGKVGIKSAMFNKGVLVIGADYTQLIVETLSGQSVNISHPFKVNGISTLNNKFVVRSDTAMLNIVVGPQDFVIDITPDVQTTAPGDMAIYMITLLRLNGFTGDVALTTNLDSMPGVQSVVINPSNLTGMVLTATLTVTTLYSTPDATNLFTVFGNTPNLNGSPAQRSDNATLVILSD